MDAELHYGGSGLSIPGWPQLMYRALAGLDQSVVAIGLRGEVLYWDAGAERLYGYSTAEAIGRPVTDLIVPSVDPGPVADWHAGLLGGQRRSGDWKVRDRTGRTLTVSVVSTSIVDDDGAVVGLIGMFSDVSQHRAEQSRARRALAALEVSERRFRACFDHSPIAQALLTSDGRFASVNDALCRLLGVGRDQIEGGTFLQYIQSIYMTDIDASWQALMDGHTDVLAGEHLLRGEGGLEIPVLVYAVVLRGTGGAADGLVVVVQDLSGVRSAQRKLTRHDALVTALARQATGSAMVLDTAGAIRHVTPAVAAAGGLKPATNGGISMWDRIHPTDASRVRRVFDGVVAGGTGCTDSSEFLATDVLGRYRSFEAAWVNHLDDPDIAGVVCTFHDVTERVEGARALRDSEARYRAIVETAQEGIWSVDLAGTTWYANHKTAGILGVTLQTVYDTSIATLIDPDGSAGIARLLRDGDALQPEQFEVTYRHPDTSMRALRCSVSVLRDERDRTGLLAMISDVTESRLAEEQLCRRAMYDDLTGLPNRTLLGDRLHDAVTRRHHRGNGSVALLFVDLDQFRMVNQSRGHAAGDALLVLVARRLGTALRPEDTVSRFGGDKFAVVCEGASESEARVLAGRLQAALASPFDVDGQRVHLSASVGVAVSPPNPPVELLRFAETAMYSAKSLGAGRIATFDRALADEAAHRLELSNDLHDALHGDELTLHYQPVVDLTDGGVLGCEALARWHHPIRGPISPMTFVGIAETTGQAPALDRWALTRACREADVLTDLMVPGARISVNISARNLAHPDLEDTVLTAIQGSPLSGGGLVLEITETAVMDNPDKAREVLHRLMAFGVETAIDDFGTGYSSLAYLSRLPVSILKIDRCFVKDITTNPDSLAITASVIKLAHAMGLKVIAEGIETAEQLDLLRQLGCTAGQGFLFSPGLPPQAFADLLGRLPGGRFDVTVPEPSDVAFPEAAAPRSAPAASDRSDAPPQQTRSGPVKANAPSVAGPRETLTRRAAERVVLPQPITPTAIDAAATRAVHQATRALVHAASPREVVDVVLALVSSLGGAVVAARLAPPNALPLDLSFGAAEPLLPIAKPASIAQLNLEVLLPPFLEDAREVAAGLRHTAQLRDEASYDQLTGLLNRRALDRQLHRLNRADTIAMIDLDHFKQLNDTAGHAAGDVVLTSFGRLVRDHVRAEDLVARYGGEELVIALVGAGPELLHRRIEQMRQTWQEVRPYPITFSAGVAAVLTTGEAALRSADQAMYGAKRAGRDRTQVQM